MFNDVCINNVSMTDNTFVSSSSISTLASIFENEYGFSIATFSHYSCILCDRTSYNLFQYQNMCSHLIYASRICRIKALFIIKDLR